MRKEFPCISCCENCGLCQVYHGREVSRKWCEMNNTDQITPETINCMGCRTDGIKFAYCDIMCQIRKCAAEKGYETCADCFGKSSCVKIAPFLGHEVAKKNLGL